MLERYLGRPLSRLDVPGKSIPGATTVGTTSVLVLGANGKRYYAVFVNDGSTVIYLHLGPGPAVVNTGIRLNANGGSYEITLQNPYWGPIYAISTEADKVLCTTEQE
jgi:hypothetical protein